MSRATIWSSSTMRILAGVMFSVMGARGLVSGASREHRESSHQSRARTMAETANIEPRKASAGWGLASLASCQPLPEHTRLGTSCFHGVTLFACTLEARLTHHGSAFTH